jgi:hypothetical protein
MHTIYAELLYSAVILPAGSDSGCRYDMKTYMHIIQYSTSTVPDGLGEEGNEFIL